MVIHPGLNVMGNRGLGYIQRQPISLWNSPSCLLVIEPNNFHLPVSIQTSGSYRYSLAPSIRLTIKYLNTGDFPRPAFPPDTHHQSLQVYITWHVSEVVCLSSWMLSAKSFPICQCCSWDWIPWSGHNMSGVMWSDQPEERWSSFMVFINQHKLWLHLSSYHKTKS